MRALHRHRSVSATLSDTCYADDWHLTLEIAQNPHCQIVWDSSSQIKFLLRDITKSELYGARVHKSNRLRALPSLMYVPSFLQGCHNVGWLLMTEQILDFIFTSSPLGISFPRDRSSSSHEINRKTSSLQSIIAHTPPPLPPPITAAVLCYSLVSHHYHAPKARSWFMATMRRSLSAGLTVNLSLSLSFRVSSFGIRLSILLVLRENGSAVYEMKIVRTICARQQSLKSRCFFGSQSREYAARPRGKINDHNW